LALAAIATVASGLDKGDRNDIWISDSFQRAREHFLPLFLAALFTFSIFLAGMAAIGFIVFALFRMLGRPSFARFGYGVSFFRFYGCGQYRQLVRNGYSVNSRAGHERLGGSKKKCKNQQWTRGFSATPRF
jgi:hypothetical protein